MFECADKYPFLKPLEEHWEDIRDEYLQIKDSRTAWPETYLYNQGWDTLGFFFKGHELTENTSRCPKTWALLKQVPDLYIAGFSILKPKAIIYPHIGYTTEVLRSHLGLICPSGAWIEVEGVRNEWSEGELFVFDDTKPHQAANPSDEERVVMIADFRKK